MTREDGDRGDEVGALPAPEVRAGERGDRPAPPGGRDTWAAAAPLPSRRALPRGPRRPPTRGPRRLWERSGGEAWAAAGWRLAVRRGKA